MNHCVIELFLMDVIALIFGVCVYDVCNALISPSLPHFYQRDHVILSVSCRSFQSSVYFENIIINKKTLKTFLYTITKRTKFTVKCVNICLAEENPNLMTIVKK